MFLSDRFQGEKEFSLPELFTGHLGGYIFARRVYLWRFVTLGTVEEDLSYRPAMCSLLTIFVKMIRWYDTMKTSCTLREVHHSITLELWFSAGISRSCGKADLNWLLRELRHAVKLWHTFASSTLLRCRHARCAHEMRLARQLELTLSIHHLQNDHCLKGLQSGFCTISWIFHVISTIQGKHYVTCASQVEDLDLRDLDDLFWWQKKTTGIQWVVPLPSWNAAVATFLFPVVFFFFPTGTRPGRSGAVQSLEFHLLTSINLQSFSKLKESQESVSVPFTTLRILRI